MVEQDAANTDPAPGPDPDEGVVASSGENVSGTPGGLTSLGVALEQAREATGMSTTAFLRAHLLHRHTWDRLLYERPGPDDQPIPDDVVLRYGQAAGLLDSTTLALARDAAATSGDTHPVTDTASMTPLGVTLERGRRASGLTTRAFLRRHGLKYRTWQRLLHDQDRPPRVSTVLRYARAAGIADPTALALAGPTLDPDEELGALGSALEGERRKTGEPTTVFLKKRGLSYATWYRLLRRSSYQRAGGTWPRSDLVHRYAVAAGVDVDLALRLVQYDRTASDSSSAAPSDGSAGDATKRAPSTTHEDPPP